jgi:hypothetical protein
MRTKFIICLALFTFILPVVLRADTDTYDSVEWLTAMADQIGVYHVERIYGPHSVTNDLQHFWASIRSLLTMAKFKKAHS